MYEKEKKPEDFLANLGGETITEVHAAGRHVRVHTVRDCNGNIVSVWEEPLIFGIF